MNKQSHPSLQKSIALGALLLLAATASGCGVGLPTQPDVDAGAVNERSAGVQLTDPVEFDDSGDPGGGPDPEVPETEIVIPTPSGPRAGLGGWAHGHNKDKWKNRP